MRINHKCEWKRGEARRHSNTKKWKMIFECAGTDGSGKIQIEFSRENECVRMNCSENHLIVLCVLQNAHKTFRSLHYNHFDIIYFISFWFSFCVFVSMCVSAEGVGEGKEVGRQRS